MSKFKMGALFTLGLTFVSAAPAFAHNDLNNWMLMMQRLRQQNAAQQQTIMRPATSAFASEWPAVQAGQKHSIVPGSRP